MFDDVLLAQSAVDGFKNAAYDFVIEGESYRSRSATIAFRPCAVVAFKARTAG